MKILYSHRTQSADGQYVHIRELTEALAARGHEIIMAGPGGGEDNKKKALDAGSVSWRRLIPGFAYEAAEMAYSVPAFQRLQTLFTAKQPQLLYQRYNLYYHAGAWLARKYNLPFILEVNAPLAEERARHGGLSLKKTAQRSEESIWRAADMVLPVTNVLADHVRAVGVPDERIRVIHNGVSKSQLDLRDGGAIRNQYGLQDKLVLGFTGFVRPWHGVDKVIDFIGKAGRTDLHLLLVGDGDIRADLESRAKEYGIADQVTTTGVIQRELIPDYVAAFDIALQPAVTAYASPLKLFEYMALAKPVLAPSRPNICEVLTDGENALLFESENDGSFFEGLKKLIDDAQLRQRLGAAARDTIVERDYTWAGNARRVEAMAEELIRKTHDCAD